MTKKTADNIDFDDAMMKALDKLLAWAEGDVAWARQIWIDAFEVVHVPEFSFDTTSAERAAELRKKFHLVKPPPAIK